VHIVVRSRTPLWAGTRVRCGARSRRRVRVPDVWRGDCGGERSLRHSRDPDRGQRVRWQRDLSLGRAFVEPCATRRQPL